MKKRILGVILALMMCISMIPTAVLASSNGEYPIIVENGTAYLWGKVATSASEGDSVDLIADPAPEGMEFVKWIVVSGDTKIINDTYPNDAFLTMPAGAVTVRATYRPLPTLIPSVEVTGFVEPVLGASPCFSLTIPEDAPYHFASREELDSHSFLNSENNYNGIWWSGNDGKITLTPESTFDLQTAYSYSMQFVLVPEDGYRFSSPSNLTLNGGDELLEYVFQSDECLSALTITFTLGEPTPEKYAVTVENGSAEVNGEAAAEACEGDTVSLRASDSAAGQIFDHWEVVSGGVTLDDASAPNTTFTMPANAVSVRAVYREHNALVTFKIVNGTWDGRSAADLTVKVPLTKGVGTLSASQVPTGMVPNAGFSGGGWDKVPNTAENGISGNVTYTYRFTETPLFRLIGANVIMGNNLDMMFAIPQDAVSDWDGHYAVIRRSYSDGRPAQALRIDFADWERSGSVYTVTYQGIAAKEMIDDLTVTVYNGSGKAVSDPWADSLRDYAMRILNKSRDAKQKTLLVDMLNYGAASQKHFGYAKTDLANNQLSRTQKALASELQPFESKLDRGSQWVASNLVLESNIKLMAAYRDITPDMTARIEFTNHMGNPVSTVIDGSRFEQVGSLYAVVIEDLVVADARIPVTITILDGNRVVTTSQESIEDYLARMNTVSDLFASVMKFADSAHAYLHQ